MRTLLLTIVGPDGTADLVLPADVPLGELIPLVLRAAVVREEPTSDERWTLAPLGGEPLAMERTLIEAGVLDGRVLHLRPQADQGEVPQRVIARADLLEPGSPMDRGRALLPSPPALRERLRRGGPYLARLDEAIRAPSLRRCATIAVVSPKGGVGKSTVAVLLGSLLSRVRDELVVAVDVDSDYGSLGPWLAPEHSVSAYDLSAATDAGYVSGEPTTRLATGPDGLRVCPAPGDPTLMAGLDRQRYAELIVRLQDVPKVLVLDCGTGLGQPGTQAAILACDQLVVVTDGEPATLSQVSAAAALLRHAGPPIVIAVNRGRLGRDDAAGADALFPYAAALAMISSETAAARALSAGEFAWASAPRSWQRDVRELAAVVVSAWPRLRLADASTPS